MKTSTELQATEGLVGNFLETITPFAVNVVASLVAGLVLLGLGAFIWSIRSGQYDDMQGPAYRILDDDTDRPA